MKIEEKTILWKPVSEYTGGRVLATNGLDILVGELNPEGDCVSEDCSGIHLCGITHFAKIAGFFPELKESKDEKIRNQIINFIEEYGNPIHCEWQKDWIAWLEKQDKQNPCETCEEPRLNCQNFPCERKKNFKPANKVEPKFKVGDWVVDNECGKVNQITSVRNKGYDFANGDYMLYECAHKELRLWDISDAKDGDVLAYNDGSLTILRYRLSGLDAGLYISHVLLTDKIEFKQTCAINNVHPATKEQRDLLFQKMKEAGYEWNAEKKELKKIDNEEYNGEDYGIDSLYHAQRILEKTLGKVDGYQTDDGILSHQCAITAVKKLYEHKPAKWSEEDIRNIEDIDSVIFHDKDLPEDTCVRLRNWLESLNPQNHWKPTEAQLASLRIACDRNDRVGFDLTQLLKELKEL